MAENSLDGSRDVGKSAAIDTDPMTYEAGFGEGFSDLWFLDFIALTAF